MTHSCLVLLSHIFDHWEGQLQVSSQVLYLVKRREHDPKASLNEVCHFVLEELMEEVGGGVGS